MEGQILVVDNDPQVVRNITRLVQRRAMVRSAACVRSAIDEMRNAPIDGVVLDVDLGTSAPMGGFEVLEVARSTRPYLAALFVTDRLTHEVVRRVHALRAEFLGKPPEPSNVLQFVERAIAERSTPDGGTGIIREVSERCRLSPAEKEILSLGVEGWERAQILEVRGISPNTYRTHLTSLLRKIGAPDLKTAANQLLRAALRQQVRAP